MEKKINLVELLKDCPKGMELYSTIFGPVYFEGVRDTGNAVLIDVKTVCTTEYQFYPDGKFNTYYYDSEMTLFPSKDVRTWEGIEAPFKDGDIVSTDDGIFTAIVDKVAVCEVEDLYNHDEEYDTYCHICYNEEDYKVYFSTDDTPLHFSRLANEEERERLFQAIKENGYKWNAETKTLEELIIPKFKVGDRIKYKGDDAIGRIEKIDDNVYHVDYSFDDGVVYVGLKSQDDYELVPNKFDINTLKPFESRVLVRDKNTDEWRGHFFSHYDCNSDRPYVCIGVEGTNEYKRCIPYKENEHLLGTTNNCDEFYKTWND